MTEIKSSSEHVGSDRVLYAGKDASLVVPIPPKIPFNEGLSLEVRGAHDDVDTPKQVLQRCLMGLGAAKVIAESDHTRDAWSNTRIENGQTVSIYGRVPGEENSWRKPVDTQNREVSQDASQTYYQFDTFSKLMRRYLPKWEQLGKHMTLFSDGVRGKDVTTTSREGTTVWENDAFNLEVIHNPHLDGLHLVVHPRKSLARQWQTVRETTEDKEQEYMVQTLVQQTLEATAVAMGVQALLAPGVGEIHNSGNWAGGLKSTEEGGTLSLENFALNRGLEKRKHRPDLAITQEEKDALKGSLPDADWENIQVTDFGTSMHVHVYLPEDPESPVILPQMSANEALERLAHAKKQDNDTQAYEDILKEWGSIPVITPEKIEVIKDALGNNRLTDWIRENCAGPLFETSSAKSIG